MREVVKPRNSTRLAWNTLAREAASNKLETVLFRQAIVYNCVNEHLRGERTSDCEEYRLYRRQVARNSTIDQSLAEETLQRYQLYQKVFTHVRASLSNATKEEATIAQACFREHLAGRCGEARYCPSPLRSLTVFEFDSSAFGQRISLNERKYISDC